MAVGQVVAGCLGRSRIRIWDAGCAMGQEPYTLAILLAEKLGHFAFRNLEIHATDYDKPLLEILEKGIYPAEELQRVPADLFEKYFEPVNGDRQYRLIDMIRNCIRTRHHDLLSFTPIRDGFSLVVCKNVLLHFQYDERVEVIRAFHRALEPGGIFVTEHTQKMPAELSGHFVQTVPDGQVFRKVAVAA
jgi:chemotaxis protein methyltransferase CheR